ncbi:prepilin-type N-terminal cleavage/methylation domain-containing protein [Methylomonas sp. AM2-LC]|uniref:pilin n=1 Tax=Methylomonas sp. AM2-LC TaxID=3153301 RepID=UPI0032636AB3
MQRIEKGFTLIELMIVVSIIGILVLIALPAYSNYVAKSQLAEATGLLSGFKIPVMTAVDTTGLVNCNNSASGALSSLVSSGNYVNNITLSTDNTSYCKALTSFNTNTGVASYQVSNTYWFGGAKIGWTCAANLPANLMLPGCSYSLNP